MGRIRSNYHHHSERLAVVGAKNLKTHFIIGMILPEQLGDGGGSVIASKNPLIVQVLRNFLFLLSKGESARQERKQQE